MAGAHARLTRYATRRTCILRDLSLRDASCAPRAHCKARVAVAVASRHPRLHEQASYDARLTLSWHDASRRQIDTARTHASILIRGASLSGISGERRHCGISLFAQLMLAPRADHAANIRTRRLASPASNHAPLSRARRLNLCATSCTVRYVATRRAAIRHMAVASNVTQNNISKMKGIYQHAHKTRIKRSLLCLSICITAYNI